MKTRKIIAIGVTAMIFLETVFTRSIRLLKGEQIMDFLARIGGLKDVSLMSLLNIAFVALFSFFKRVRVHTHAGCVNRSVVLRICT